MRGGPVRKRITARFLQAVGNRGRKTRQFGRPRQHGSFVFVRAGQLGKQGETLFRCVRLAACGTIQVFCQELPILNPTPIFQVAGGPPEHSRLLLS